LLQRNINPTYSLKKKTGNVPDGQALSRRSLFMAETLTLLHLSGARPDRASDLALRRSPKPSLLARIVTAMMEQRQRQADHHIARYIERNGGTITDAVERGIESRILGRRF